MYTACQEKTLSFVLVAILLNTLVLRSLSLLTIFLNVFLNVWIPTSLAAVCRNKFTASPNEPSWPRSTYSQQLDAPLSASLCGMAVIMLCRRNRHRLRLRLPVRAISVSGPIIDGSDGLKQTKVPGLRPHEGVDLPPAGQTFPCAARSVCDRRRKSWDIGD
jgi:hypothetical protein